MSNNEQLQPEEGQGSGAAQIETDEGRKRGRMMITQILPAVVVYPLLWEPSPVESSLQVRVGDDFVLLHVVHTHEYQHLPLCGKTIPDGSTDQT